MILLNYYLFSNSIRIFFLNIDNYNVHENEINAIIYKFEIILDIV